MATFLFKTADEIASNRLFNSAWPVAVLRTAFCFPPSAFWPSAFCLLLSAFHRALRTCRGSWMMISARPWYETTSPQSPLASLPKIPGRRTCFVGSEDNAGKRASPIILTEIQKRVPGAREINAQNKPRDASAFSHQGPGIANVRTGRGVADRRRIRDAGDLLGYRYVLIIY